MAVARTRSGKFAAQVVQHGKLLWLGVFTTEQAARLACAIWRSKHLDEWDAAVAQTKSEIQLRLPREWLHLSPRERACTTASKKQAR
jgi:hypothetical protein